MKRAFFAAAALILVAFILSTISKDPILNKFAQQPVTATGSEIAETRTVAASLNVPGKGRASSDRLATIYDAPNLDAQESVRLSAAGALKFDAILMHIHGFDLCNYLNGSEVKTFASKVASRGNFSPQDLASVRTVDAFRTKYCSNGTDVAQKTRSYDYIERALAEAAASGDPHAENLLEVLNQLSQEEDLSSSELRLVEGRLTDLLRRTDSPALFIETVTTLHGSALGNWMPPSFEAPRLSEEELGQIRLYGSAIAMCNEFGICRPGSIYTMVACMPKECHPQGEVDGRLKRILSVDIYYWATRYAHALRTLRRGG